MSFPQNPWPMYGYAPGNGVNVAVTQKNLSTNEEETVTTASDGSFILDPANLASGYSELGDIIRVTSGIYFKEVVCDTATYPDGREIVLDQIIPTPPIPTYVFAGTSKKFVKMEDRLVLAGGMPSRRSGLG